MEHLYSQRSKLFRKHEWNQLSQDNRSAVIKVKLQLER